MSLFGQVWYLAVVDDEVGYGEEGLARSSWRRNGHNRLCRDMRLSARRHWHVKAVVLVNVDMRERWNYGSAWAAW